MPALVAVYNSEGLVGRCDFRCYAATSAPHRCRCICRGVNHGVGLQKAMDNVASGVGLGLDDLSHYATLHKLEFDSLTAIDRVQCPNPEHARDAAYMILNQFELPFDYPPQQ